VTKKVKRPMQRDAHVSMYAERGTDGISAEELRDAVRKLYTAKPELAHSQLEMLFAAGGPAHDPADPDSYDPKHVLHRDFHRVIWTPPYHSDANPIETQWAVAKQYVAKQYFVGRKTPELRDQLIAGFYGDGKGHTGVSAASCSAAIGHLHTVLNQWIASHPRLRALFPAKTTAKQLSIDFLNAKRRAAYGPTAPLHRAVRGRRAAPAPAAAGSAAAAASS
jgi:hypothetical protein